MLKKPTLVAKVLIIDDQNRGLIMTRADHDADRASQIDLPGGGLDEGESWEQGAARETLEESGLLIRPTQLYLVSVDASMKGHDNIIRALFIARQYSGKLQLSHEIGLVKTDHQSLQTSMPGVLAVGDCRSGATMQIATAVGEGATAALRIRESLEGKQLGITTLY